MALTRIKNALWLSFADDPASGPTYSLDDHHQNISDNTRELSYGEVLTAVAQYRTDRDTVLWDVAPNSPFNFNYNAGGSRIGIKFKDHETGESLQAKVSSNRIYL